MVRWRAAVCDTSLINDSARRKAFARDLDELPAVCWHTHASEHLANTTLAIRQLLAKHFPRPQRRPRKPWSSDKSWEMLCLRRTYREAAQECTRKIKIERVAVAFVAWRSCREGWPETCLPLNILPPTKDTFQAYAYAIWSLDATLSVLKCSLHSDRQLFVGKIRETAARAAAKNDSRTLYSCVQKLRAKSPRPPSGILLENGQPATDPLMVRQRWQRHFAEAMGGDICT